MFMDEYTSSNHSFLIFIHISVIVFGNYLQVATIVFTSIWELNGKAFGQCTFYRSAFCPTLEIHSAAYIKEKLKAFHTQLFFFSVQLVKRP